MKTTSLVLALLTSLLGGASCKKQTPAEPASPPAAAQPAAPPAPAAEPAAAAAPAAPSVGGKSGQVEVTITDDGFVPARIPAKMGEPIILAITRKAERTCATEILFEGQAKEAKTDLPLNQKVLVTYTPKKSGDLKFGCAMGMMIGGVLAVEP